MEQSNKKLDEMSWKKVKMAISEGYTKVVFGIGATEQHGPSLPLQTDARQADHMASFISAQIPYTLQAPTIRVGYSAYHMHFPGTISLRESTLTAVVEDYIDSLVHHSFDTIIIFISHGGDVKPTKEALQRKQAAYPAVKFIYYYDQNAMPTLGELCQQFKLTPTQIGSHAGDMEASIMASIAPDLVDNMEFIQGYTAELTDELHEKFHREGIEILSPMGVIGDQTRASKEKGEIYISKLGKVVIDYIQAQLDAE